MEKVYTPKLTSLKLDQRERVVFANFDTFMQIAARRFGVFRCRWVPFPETPHFTYQI